MRAEVFSSSLDVLYGGLEIDKNFSVNFFPIVGYQNPGSRSGSGLAFSQKCWIRIRIGNTAVRYLFLQRMKECQWLDRPPLPPIGGHNLPGCVQGSPGGSVGGRRHLQASREQRARRSGRYQAAHFLRQVSYSNIRISRFRLFSLISNLNPLYIFSAY